MRLLIYILALTSAFFISADEPDLSDLKSPKSEFTWLATAGLGGLTASGDGDTEVDAKTSACNAVSAAVLPSRYNQDTDTSRISFGSSSCSCSSSSSCSIAVTFTRSTKYFNGDKLVWSDPETVNSHYSSQATVSAKQDFMYSCPPPAFPLHKTPVPIQPKPLEGPTFMCANELIEPEPEKDCPAGYHSKAVSKAMGSDSCMPKECPAAGSGEDLYSSKMTGGVPFNGGGMYCNDGCAYSVKSENVTSDQYALGTSQGAACGDKPYDNKKLSDEGDEGQCETNTVDGVTIMFCNNEPAPPTDKDDDANNDGSKEDETEKPKKDLEDCASDDNACMLRNLIKEQSNNTQVQIENDNKLHNKMVDTATNNTNILKTAIDDLHTTVFVGLQKNDKLEAVKASKMNDLISAVREGNQILTDKPIGGGGGGNGGGDGEGEGGGDCEGGAADCVPIVGSEIPIEVVNLSQYADKYDDWLPNAELPEEKCIVLTTGQSLCFSFSAFIILFQAISGLIVISSLLHSARIIAGAI
ncbi:hypothetical protein [Vibrio casei]|uniref:hypothetical protein n=1 Tax=Vibrio casei TaxID=673372 RepID=UPI003F9D0FD8